MAILVSGLVAVIIFYLIILAVGLWAAWKKRKSGGEDKRNERPMVGARDIGLIVGSFTLTATWVGGGYINGIAEYVYTPGYGLMWTTSPFSACLTLLIIGKFFVKRMKNQGFTTMLDPMQYKYGRWMGVLLFLPALLGDLCWSASILAALAGTLSVIIDLSYSISVIFSACIAVSYTLVGGLYSVAYTDIVQLSFVFVGLWLAIPFAFTHPAVTSITTTAFEAPTWLGTWDWQAVGYWVDGFLLVAVGGLPWQSVYQRILATASATKAEVVSYIAGFATLAMAVPSILFGAIAASTDWNATDYDSAGKTPLDKNEQVLILPIILRYLTPTAVAVIGLGALAAAVMSSIDSAILSSSSQFTRNVYNFGFRHNATRRELQWVMRLATVSFTVAAAALALTVHSVYILWFLCVDLVYVALVPQFVCALFLDPNTYGSLPAYVIGIILRVGGGEPAFNMDPFIHYPGGLNFPFKTFAMVVSFITLVVFSYVAKYLFEKGIIPEKYDIFQCKLARGGRTLTLEEIIGNDVVYENVKLEIIQQKVQL
ncbi:high affinity choline transporter 1-like [Clavelina lepadiformis]|uniref:high affinity choline transporter 1-like n=1 Tax=Clavelina lepadiformis TaxID=159417 RepID=UPI004042C697